MENCKKCKSERIAAIGAKCSDLFSASIGPEEGIEGYVPDDMGIGGGDYVEFEYCLECGQIQGEFPLPKTELEEKAETEANERLERQLEQEGKSKNFNVDDESTW